MSGWVLLTYISAGSLVAVTGLRQFFIDPLPDSLANAVWFIIQISPLVLTLPSLMSGSIKGIFLMCLASLLYFVHGVMAAFDPALAWTGILEIVFSLSLCATTTLLVRRLREQEGAASGQ